MNEKPELSSSRIEMADSEKKRLINLGKSAFKLESLQNLDRNSAVHCQSMISHGTQFGIWETPKLLVARSLSKSLEMINIRNRIVRFLRKRSLIRI